jgi:hypothetical protein
MPKGDFQMKLFKKTFVFVLVLCGFVSFARAQAAVITNGTFNITGAFPPNPTSATWIIGGEGFFSNLPTNEVQTIYPTVKRAGTTVEPFTLSYLPQSSARGNVVNGIFQWTNIYYRSDNGLNRTNFNFHFPAHALPKFTPNRNDVFIDVPFTMDAAVTGYNSPNSLQLLFSRTVTGGGIAHLNYIRMPGFRSRRSPHPDVWLAYVLFDFDAPAANGK